MRSAVPSVVFAAAVPIGIAAFGFSSTAEQAQTVAMSCMLLLIGSAIWAARRYFRWEPRKA